MPIAFVGTHHYVARLGHTKVATRHACPCLHKLVAQVLSCTACKVCWVVIAVLLAYALLLKHAAYLLALKMYSGHNDVAWFLMQQLQDALAKVGLYHVYSVLLEKGVHAALLG